MHSATLVSLMVSALAPLMPLGKIAPAPSAGASSFYRLIIALPAPVGLAGYAA